MYWVGAPGPWADGTSSFGVSTLGTQWGFAEGRVGGPLMYHTYIRVFNPDQNQTAYVQITYLREDGSTLVQNYSVNPWDFLTVDVNGVPGLRDGESVGALIQSNIGVATQRSMYWNSGGVFWAGGLTTAGTRIH